MTIDFPWPGLSACAAPQKNAIPSEASRNQPAGLCEDQLREPGVGDRADGDPLREQLRGEQRGRRARGRARCRRRRGGRDVERALEQVLRVGEQRGR